MYYNPISLARLMNGKHPYKEGATKEDYLKELKEEKEANKWWTDKTIFQKIAYYIRKLFRRKKC